MADKLINQLTQIDTIANDDSIPIYDASAEETKKVLWEQMKTGVISQNNPLPITSGAVWSAVSPLTATTPAPTITGTNLVNSISEIQVSRKGKICFIHAYIDIKANMRTDVSNIIATVTPFPEVVTEITLGQHYSLLYNKYARMWLGKDGKIYFWVSGGSIDVNLPMRISIIYPCA